MKSVWMLSVLMLSTLAFANGQKGQVEPKPSYVFKNVCHGEHGLHFAHAKEFRVFADHRIMVTTEKGSETYFGHSNFDSFLRHLNVCQPANKSPGANVDAAAEFHKRELALARMQSVQRKLDEQAGCMGAHRSCSRAVDFKSPGTITDSRSIVQRVKDTWQQAWSPNSGSAL